MCFWYFSKTNIIKNIYKYTVKTLNFPCFYSTKVRSSTHMYPFLHHSLSLITSSSTPHFLTNSITSSLTYPFSLYCYFIPDFLTISSLFLFSFPNRLNLFSRIFPITFALLLNSFFYIHLSFAFIVFPSTRTTPNTEVFRLVPVS